MRYYYHPLSPDCRKVTTVIADYGLSPEMFEIDLLADEQTSDRYLEINPSGKVPTVQDGDLTLHESNAIMVHLSEKTGSDMWPADSRRIEVLDWLFWEQSELRPASLDLCNGRILATRRGDKVDGTAVAEAIRRLEKPLSILDSALEGRRYLVGDHPSLADLAVASHVSFARSAEAPIGDASEVSRWLESLDAMIAWKESDPGL